MKITVIGAGYVGLVSAACFSEFGYDVACVDKDESKIASLLNGEIPIFEPGLDRLVEENSEIGRLTFDTDLAGSSSAKTTPPETSDIPLGRLGVPQDMANLIRFLVGPGASYLSGQSIHLNGAAHCPL